MNEASRLHHKDEPHLVSGTLYSLLDLMGMEVICDRCGNWQRISAITTMQADTEMRALGWRERNGKHECPECTANEQAPTLRY